jgi:DNA (cytosine-5)-methyltransferase 1
MDVVAISDARGLDKNEHGRGWSDEGVAFTLKSVSHQAVCFQHQNSAACGMEVADISPTLQTDKEPAVCYENHAQDSRIKECGEVCPQLNAKAGTGGGNLPLVQMQSIVRRLTPRECERLQGFPDDYTLIPLPLKSRQTRVRWASDGSRYKALGNSMAVPVMRWIGERIDMVNKV